MLEWLRARRAQRNYQQWREGQALHEKLRHGKPGHLTYISAREFKALRTYERTLGWPYA